MILGPFDLVAPPLILGPFDLVSPPLILGPFDLVAPLSSSLPYFTKSSTIDITPKYSVKLL